MQPNDQIEELKKELASLKSSNSVLQEQVSNLSQQILQTQQQVNLKLFTSNPATVNLTGGF